MIFFLLPEELLGIVSATAWALQVNATFDSFPSYNQVPGESHDRMKVVDPEATCLGRTEKG
jgi:hypothetical protein